MEARESFARPVTRLRQPWGPIQRLLIVWTVWMLLPCPWERLVGQEPGTETPLWQQGISTFAGLPDSGFVLPTDSAASDSSTASAPPIVSAFALPSPSWASSTSTASTDSAQTDAPKIAQLYPLGSGTASPQPPSSGSRAGDLPPPITAPANSLSARPAVPSTPPSLQSAAGEIIETIDDSVPVSTTAAPTIAAPIVDPPGIVAAIEDADVVIESPPLEQEVIHWYQYPARWAKGWDSHAEFGIDGSTGNAETLAIQTGLELKRKTGLYTLAIDIDYRQASGGGETTENNGRFNIDYDRIVGDSDWSAFGKFGLEWDAFKAFDLRVNVNGGLGYHWVRTDDASFVTRLGAGASREIGAPDDDWIGEAVLGLDAERQLTKRQKIKGKLDYFPSLSDFGDFRLVADLSWEVLLDESENLSLKVAVNDRFDSTPQGAQRNDFYYSLLLLYKF